MKDFHELPKLSDSISYLYLEHAVIEQENACEVGDLWEPGGSASGGKNYGSES